MEFDDNHVAALVFGEHDQNLAQIEKRLAVQCQTRGNRVTIVGTPDEIETAERALKSLYDQAKRGEGIGRVIVDAAVRMAESGATSSKRSPSAVTEIKTRRKVIRARSPGQKDYLETLQAKEMVFGLGPAGTGKTYLATAFGVSMLLAGQVERLILTRPAVEAGEKLGFLPGDLKDKVDPYLRPIYDALEDMLPRETVAKKLESGEIEVAPIAFMRGRTLANAFVILDEAQNTTMGQMKMVLTRLGENSRMVINGDLSQVDLPAGTQSGLAHASKLLRPIQDIGFVIMTNKDIVRHDLVAKIVAAYDGQQ